MLLVIIGISIALVPLTGGRLAALTEVRWRRIWLITTALIVQVLIISVFPGEAAGLQAAAHVLSYFLAAAFVVSNARVPGVWLIGLGGSLNLAAIAANGGVMPASRSALAAAGIDDLGSAFSNSALIAEAKLAVLGDIFVIPAGLPLSNIFSIGDVVIAAGAALGVLGICRRDVGRQSARTSPLSKRFGMTPRRSPGR